jgi:hypothetical protein
MSTNYRRTADAIHDRIVAREHAKLSVSEETAQEHCRTALMILGDLPQQLGLIPTTYLLTVENLDAICARLWKAVRQLEAEAKAAAVREAEAEAEVERQAEEFERQERERAGWIGEPHNFPPEGA